MKFFTELKQKILKFIWNHLNHQRNLRKKEQIWRYHTPLFQFILQSYRNQNSMVLTHKKTHKSMEQNRDPRNKPKIIWSINLQQIKIEYTMGKR